MEISRERLLTLSEQTGFQSASLEKAIRLLGLLKQIQQHRDLEGRLALKGGTAVNLFYFNASRLSVDIDLNYTGANDKEKMEQERPRIEKAIKQIFDRESMKVDKEDTDSHASSKWKVSYQSPEWGRDTVKVDLNCSVIPAPENGLSTVW